MKSCGMFQVSHVQILFRAKGAAMDGASLEITLVFSAQRCTKTQYCVEPRYGS
jgi:hypothetical protein